MTIVNGTSTSDYYYIRLNYTVSSTATTTSCAITLQLYWKKHHSHNLANERPCYVTATGQSQTNFTPTGSYERDKGAVVNLGSKTYTWTRGTANATKTISGYAKRSTGSTSSVSANITVPARTSVTVTYDANTPPTAVGTVQNLPASQAKYYEYALTLSSTIPTLADYVFTGWNTAADGSGTAYAAGGTLPANINVATTLYAQWDKIYVQPVVGDITLQRVETSSSTVEYDEGDYVLLTLSDCTSGDVPADLASRYKTTTFTLVIEENGNTHTLSPINTNSFSGTGLTVQCHYHVPTVGYSPSYPTSVAYPLTLTLTTAGHGSVTRTLVLASSTYPIEVAADATMITFGTPARCKQNLFLDLDINGVDADLYDALVALGWDSDVIV